MKTTDATEGTGRRPAVRGTRGWVALAAVSSLLGLPACHRDSSTSAPVARAPTWVGQVVPTSPLEGYSHAVGGQVFDAYAGVVADADVNLFVQTDRWGRGMTMKSDGAGQFFGYLPSSRIAVHVWKSGFVQQCATHAEVRGDLMLQIELTSVATLNAAHPPPPQSARGRSLTGTVFELIEGIRQPVVGAEVWAQEFDDIAMATTQSDLSGGYYLCNLPKNLGLYVTKPEFHTTFVVPDESATLDIQVKRK